MPDTTELIEISWRRWDYIHCLAEEPRTRQELMDELCYSYDTVYRRLKELQECHIVQRVDKKYKLTPLGKLILNKFREIDEFGRIAEILSTNPHYDDLDAKVLENANTIPVNGSYPTQPLNYITEKLMECNVVDGFTCTLLSRRAADMYHKAIVENGVNMNIITTRQVIEFLQSEHREKFNSAVKSGNLSVHITDENIPFTALVFDKSELCLIVFNSNADTKGLMTMEGIISNCSTSSVNWALERFKKLQENSSLFNVGKV
ncbi:MAG: hypothetical protein SXQ77_13020 [Halobacteria archaeon]|nr:hypothetical protein [Halobacteria archaeon]